MKRPVRQLTRDEARALFDYRDGKLFWRHAASGQRSDMLAMRKRMYGRRMKYAATSVMIGSEDYSGHYLVWNWHNGITENRVKPIDGDFQNCAIENLQEIERRTQNMFPFRHSGTIKDVASDFIRGSSGEQVDASPLILSGDHPANSASVASDFIRGSSGERVSNCCPTCAQAVTAPTYDFIVRHLELQPLHARILRAVWDGKGHPVMPGKIFDYMYEDDPDGGPSDAMMYANFKVALCRLRARLEGSGVGIENAGYRAGYRLVLKGK